jgi:integrase/recombinase XerC
MVEDFLEHLRYQKAYSPLTLKAYARDLRELTSFLEDEFETDLSDLTREHLRSWLVFLTQEKMLKPSSVARKLASARSFFQYALRKGLMRTDPSLGLKPPKAQVALPKIVKEQELLDLLASERFPDGWEGTRDRLILEMFYQTGMRRAELIGLKWPDVFYSESQIRVIGKRNKERRIPLMPHLIRELKEFKSISADFLGASSDHVFTGKRGGRMSPGLVYKVVNHYLQGTFSSQNSPHVLRHSFATHMLDKGADLNSLKELLGHASLAATQVYTHNSLEKVKKAYEQAHPKSRK